MEAEQMPNDARDETSGRFSEKFTDDEFINAVREADLPTTSEVAEAVGCKYRTAYGRLGDLEENGRLASRKVGNSLVWLVVDDGSDE